MQFDARAAKALEPGSHLLFSDYPGLRLTASRTKRAWIYRYKSPLDGKMRQVTLGAWPAMSFPAAIVEWERLRRNRDAGIDVALEIKSARAEQKNSQVQQAERVYTVKMLCDDYIAGHIDRARTKQNAAYVRWLFDAKLQSIYDMPVDDVTRPVAFGLIAGMAADAPVLAKILRCELGAAWDHGIDAGTLSENTVNWWRLILKNKIRSKGRTRLGENIGEGKRFLSDEELGELINWLPNFSRAVADVLTLYLWTGTRGSEIVAMAGSEIAKEGGQVWWTIPKAKTKNARHGNATDLRVPLFGRALAVAIRRKALYGDGWLFPNRDRSGHISQNVISTKVNIAQPYAPVYGRDVPRLSVSGWSPHDLRRSVRTLLAKLGCPDSVGEAILGHMPAGIAGVYNRHQYDAERVEWLGKLDARLEILAGDFAGRVE